MAITYSAPQGTHITSFAMNETLGDQSQQSGNNTVVVSDDISTAGNGQIGTKYTTYVGRLIIINLGTANEQRRMCISQAAGTGNTIILTVHEDWDTNPVASTDTIHVAYDVDDIETGGAGGGVSLSSKTGLYEFSNTLTVDNGGGIQNSFGQGVELDDNGGSVEFIVSSGGYFFSGYESAGNPVNGGLFTSYNNTTGEPNWQFQSGSFGYFYDVVFWSQLVVQQFECANGSSVYFNNCKFISNTEELLAYDAVIISSVASGRQSATNIMRMDNGTTISGMVLSNIEYLDSIADTTTETLIAEGLVFSGVPGYVNVRQNKTWNIIDPVWRVTTYSDLTWTGTATGNELNDRRSIKATVQKADGTKLQNALINVYENQQTADLVLKLLTNIDGFAKDSFIYKKHATNSVTTTYSGHALQSGKWLYKPFTTTQLSTENFNGVIVLSSDNNIQQTTQATAIATGSGIVWHEDTNPSEIFDFDNGSGTLAEGMIITFTSGAVGTITESLDGDSSSGTLHLKDRNTTAIVNGDSFSRTGGTAGTFSGDYIDDTGLPFSIWIECDSLPYQNIYDYLSAIQTETTLSADGELIWEWCRDSQTQALYNTGSSFYTERSYGKGIILIHAGTGTMDYETDDNGDTFTPPVSRTLSIYVQDESKSPIQNAQTSIFLSASPFTQLMNEDTLATGYATEAYTGTVPVEVVVKVRKSDDLDSPRYLSYSSVQNITTDGLSLIVTLEQNPFL